MCVILVCPPKARPDFETLRQCEQANPHGAGIAWREHGEVRWVKTDDLQEIHRLAQAKHGEIVIHFRIASVGGVCPELRHPFPVSRRAGLNHTGSAKAVLFQNGTWSGYGEALRHAQSEGHELPKGTMSDARAAAFLVSIYGKKILESLNPSRWVFFGAKNTAMFGDWHSIGGIKYSNTYWQPRATYHPHYRSSQNVPKRIQCEPDDEFNTDSIPGATPYKTELERELELWDMSMTDSYWDKIKRNTPKPVKTTK